MSGAAKPSAAGSALASGQGAKVTVAYINISGSNISLFVTNDGGYFQKHRLTVDMQFINGASKGMGALLANQVDICQCGAEIVSANVAGADLEVTATLTPVYPYKFEAAPSIKSFADLKGKPVGMSSIGGAVDIITRIVLQKNGLNPDKDVTLVPDNGSTFRIDALLGGATVAAMADPPGLQKIEAQGFHTLADPAADKIPTANSTIVASRAWINVHHDLMQAYVDAIVEGTARTKKDKAFAVSVMKKYFKSDDDKVMGDTWDFFANEVEPSIPVTTPEQFTETINGLAKENPKVKDYDISKAIDASFVKSAADRGLDKS
ncbi:MAG TPA: ABC transporter substrate-binding protein [Chloroflexota bacterium]|nr:ABC transporter substrate-binding protein [Chloroflexota bacterium]